MDTSSGNFSEFSAHRSIFEVYVGLHTRYHSKKCNHCVDTEDGITDNELRCACASWPTSLSQGPMLWLYSQTQHHTYGIFLWLLLACACSKRASQYHGCLYIIFTLKGEKTIKTQPVRAHKLLRCWSNAPWPHKPVFYQCNTNLKYRAFLITS